MKTITAFILTAAVAFSLIGCGAPANNAPANTNTAANTAPKAPAAPTADALAALDKAATEAYFKGDASYFETFLHEKAGGAMGGKHYTKADILKIIGTAKCDVKEFKMEDPQMSPIDNDTAVLSYRGIFEGSCTEGGKKIPTPSPVRAATIFVRNGDKWQAVWHTEVPIMEAKDEKADAGTKDEAKTADTAKKDAPAKSEGTAKKEEPKKEEPKKEEAKPVGATNTASANAAGAAPPPPPTPDANTDALVKLELAGWTAWKDNDAKTLDSLAARNLAFLDGAGKWFGNRAATLKEWENTSGCEKVTKVDVKNGFAWALSPTVEILTFDATADGTCGGQKNGTFNGTSVYIKEGDAWKLAFGAIQPAAKS